MEELKLVDLSTARMKCLGAQWLMKVVECLSDSPQIIVNGFIASGITPSFDAGKPIMDSGTDEQDDTGSKAEEISDEELEADEYSDKEFGTFLLIWLLHVLYNVYSFIICLCY